MSAESRELRERIAMGAFDIKTAFDLKLIDSTNKEQLAELEFISTELARLEAESERLRKSMALFKKELLDKEREFIADQPIKVISDVDLLLKSWHSQHFKSEVVRKAVAALRLVLFDDQDEAYQKFSCIDISESFHEHCDGIDFMFEKTDEAKESRAAFVVFIPTSVAVGCKDVAASDGASGCMLRLLVKVGYEDLIVFMPRCATFSYEEMAREIAKVVKGEEECKGVTGIEDLLRHS